MQLRLIRNKKFQESFRRFGPVTGEVLVNFLGVDVVTTILSYPFARYTMREPANIQRICL